MLMATCCEDDIISFVMPYVRDWIRSPDWKYRDAAVMAFGQYLACILTTLTLCITS